MKKELSYEKIRGIVRERILERIDYTRETLDDQILEMIDEEIVRAGKEYPVSLEERKCMRRELFHSIRRLDVLQELLEDTGITEIMINGPDRIFIEKNGALYRYEKSFSSPESLFDVIRRIVSDNNRTVNEASPVVDARLSGGERVSVVLPPVALNGPIVTIRRFPEEPIHMKDLISWGSLSPEIADFLACLVKAGFNIFVSGGTGSGKTTFLNALSEFIPPDERVITIEDNAELQIRHIDNLVSLEARNANVEGENEVTIRHLIRASLRMRPDRIIVGEVRGEEALDMLQAMNTGHDGSLSTGHANSAGDALSRLETMVLMSSLDLPVAAIRSQIASAIDIIVHLGRLRDRSRRLLEIREVAGIRDGRILLRSLYEFVEEGEREGRIFGTWVR
ncbi:MAG: CpaF family protein, partial [bacterium]